MMVACGFQGSPQKQKQFLLANQEQFLLVHQELPVHQEEFVKKMKVVRESQQSVEGYQARQEHLKKMALLMKRENWPMYAYELW